MIKVGLFWIDRVTFKPFHIDFDTWIWIVHNGIEGV